MKKALLTVCVAAVALAFALPAHAEDAAPAKPKKRQFTGTIEAMDAAAKTMTVKNKAGETKEFTFTEKCKFATADKPAAEMSDVKVGDKVTCNFSEEGGKNVCSRCGPPDAPKKKAAAPAAEK